MEKIHQNPEPKYQTYFEAIIDRIDSEKKSLNNRELLEICRESADIFSGEANPLSPLKAQLRKLSSLNDQKH